MNVYQDELIIREQTEELVVGLQQLDEATLRINFSHLVIFANQSVIILIKLVKLNYLKCNFF